MKAFEIYERLTKLVSETFMVRAVLPWVFVLLLDLGIYEFCVPDGRSLVTGFLNVELQDAESGKKSAKVLSFTDRPDIDCASTDKIKVAALPYLLCDGDAYNFGILKDMPDTETCISRLSASGEDNGRLITIAKTAIALAGNAGIEPKTRGHISPPSAAQPTPRPPICDSGNSETSQYR
jgi:hypothetical protein